MIDIVQSIADVVCNFWDWFGDILNFIDYASTTVESALSVVSSFLPEMLVTLLYLFLTILIVSKLVNR